MLIFASITDASPIPYKLEIDDSLIIGVANGNQAAFTSLYKQTKQSIYAYALSILKNPYDAEDILQDTFIKIREAAHLYQPHQKALSWVFTITKNLCLMKLRRQNYLTFQPIDEHDLESSLNHISDLEDRLVLKTALLCLSDKECQIITLHSVTGWKHREIAELLDLPVSTVLSKYHRGIKKLKTELEGKL